MEMSVMANGAATGLAQSQKQKILIIDNSATVIASLKKLLRSAGHMLTQSAGFRFMRHSG
jgi:PleD family two-component response regulator